MIKKLFGKKVASPVDDLGFGTPVDDGLKLTMGEVRQLVKITASRRGYPEPSHEMIAERIAWLERRALPGLSAWIFELSTFRGETIEQRFNMMRPNGARGGCCPFYFGASLDDRLDELTSGEPGREKVFEAPSHPVLLLPKLAKFLGPHGRLISIVWMRDEDQIIQSVMDGFRIAHRGDSSRFVEVLLHANRLGVSPYPEDQPLPPMRSGHLDHVVLPSAVTDRLANFMGSTR